jgi:HPt (histidine-containing phosphotransfer) domain-containing protein
MDAPRYFAKMQSAANLKDWAEAAHTLKGSARAVGAWAVAECAQAAEALQKTVQTEQTGHPFDPRSSTALKAALEQLGEAVRSTLAYINGLRADAPREAMPRPA